MVKVRDSDIAQGLRRVVREAKAKDEEVTVKQVRSKVEAELRLEAGLLKTDVWKSRSKEIIEEAFQDPAEEGEVEIRPAAPESRPAEPVASGRADDLKKTKKQKTSQEHTFAFGKISQPSAPVGRKNSENVQSSDGSSSGEEENESDDQDGEARQATLKKSNHPPSQVNGVKRKASAQSSSADGSASEGEDGSSKKRKTDSSTSASLNEDGESGANNEEPQIELSTSRSTAPAQSSASLLQPIATQVYHPPSGFVAIEQSQLNQNTQFSTTSLEGKQIWHITAPSSVPISSICDFTLEAIDSHTTVATHSGIEYAFTDDKDISNDPVTVFVATTEGYKPVHGKVGRRLQLQQKITLPSLTSRQASQVTGSQAAGDVAQAAVSSVRPQPKGLRMRYRPPGFGKGKLGTVGSGSESAGNDDDNDSQNTPTFQFPKALGAHGTDHRDVDNANVDVTMADVDAQASAKKSKKERKRKEKHDAKTTDTQVNGIAKVDAPLSPDPVDPPIERQSSSPEAARLKPAKFTSNGIPIEDASKDEDRAKRREEKAKRKEERRLKRERKEARRLAEEAAPA